MVDVQHELSGVFYIEFVGDPTPRRVKILNVVVNHDAHILWLRGEEDTTYNWSTIIKMTKIKE